MGYTPGLKTCPWCGAGDWLAYESSIDSVCDTECYADYWLCMFDTGETFEMFDGHPLDIPGLRRALSRYRVITFNGAMYDLPMIEAALNGATCADLHQLNDYMIVGKNRVWHRLDWVDHVDLFEVAPGQGSLKMYGGKMHSRKLQDLPYEPGSRVEWPQRLFLREYCCNDLRTTRDLLETFPAQIELREEMGREYGLDLRSKSDAQIAESVMKSLLPFKVDRPYFAPGTQFYYRPPTWLKFQTPMLQRVFEQVCASPFYITATGTATVAHDNHLVDWGSDSVRLDVHGNWVKRPADWKHEPVTIGGTQYALGIGGLHSMESNMVHRHPLRDIDVKGYYPALIRVMGIYPPQIGPVFLEYYCRWIDERNAAKESGNKKRANSRKTLNNGTFGKLGSTWSIFYAPAELIQVTVTGQLALLMQIEMMETCGVHVVSANTDGIVTMCDAGAEPVRDSVVAWWESATGFETETTDYSLLHSRDVNSYIAIKTDGEVKLKGAYAPPEPGASGWPNPTGQISVTAAVAWLRDGVPIETTVCQCTDIRQFVHVRHVKGGGSYCPNGALPKRTTQRAMRELCGDIVDKVALTAAYDALVERNASEREYLGKAVRWYYAQGSKGCIVTSVGSLVARTDGCRPLMELPDVMPDDVDYQWYINEARSILI